MACRFCAYARTYLEFRDLVLPAVPKARPTVHEQHRMLRSSIELDIIYPDQPATIQAICLS